MISCANPISICKYAVISYDMFTHTDHKHPLLRYTYAQCGYEQLEAQVSIDVNLLDYDNDCAYNAIDRIEKDKDTTLRLTNGYLIYTPKLITIQISGRGPHSGMVITIANNDDLRNSLVDAVYYCVVPRGEI